MICPSCKGPLKVKVKEQEDFLGSQVTLVAMTCPKCGYRTLDLLPAEPGEPTRLELKVNPPGDLNLLVARSAGARITIPEIGAAIQPGPASTGFITTVEGVLNRFKKHLKSERARQLIDQLLEGQPFTLVVEDPTGASAVDSLDVKKTKFQPL